MITRRDILLGAAGLAAKPAGIDSMVASSASASLSLAAPAAIAPEALATALFAASNGSGANYAASNVMGVTFSIFDHGQPEEMINRGDASKERHGDYAKEFMRKDLERSLPRSLKPVSVFRDHCRDHLRSADPKLVKQAYTLLAQMQNEAFMHGSEKLLKMVEENQPADNSNAKAVEAVRAHVKRFQQHAKTGKNSLGEWEALESIKYSIIDSAEQAGISEDAARAVFQKELSHVKDTTHAMEAKIGLAEGSLEPLLEAAKSRFYISMVDNGSSVPPIAGLITDEGLFTHLPRAFEVPADSKAITKQELTPVIREVYANAFKEAFPDAELKEEYLPSAHRAMLKGVKSAIAPVEEDAGRSMPMPVSSLLARFIPRRAKAVATDPSIDANEGKDIPSAKTPLALPAPEAPINFADIVGSNTAKLAEERIGREASPDKSNGLG